MLLFRRLEAMTLASPKGAAAMAAFPRSLSSMAVSLGGLALFLVIASAVLVSYPIGTTFHTYFYGIVNSNKMVLTTTQGGLSPSERRQDVNTDVTTVNSPFGFNSESSSGVNSIADVAGKDKNSQSGLKLNVGTSDTIHDEEEKARSNSIISTDLENPLPSNSGRIGIGLDDSNQTTTSQTKSTISPVIGNETKNAADDSGCDLFHGSWFYDPLGPTYTNNTCPIITQMQNCQGNGRPDKEYENWRWKPFQCDLPRFDAKKFLELMRGKTLAFIGDSVARNQMESMLCLLWQVEAPKNRGNRKMQRYYFRSTSTMIVRIWSSWLVHQTSEKIGFAPEGVTKLHLDAPDEGFMDFIPGFDVIVLSSGHWFAKQSVYVLNNEIVGGQLWWPKNSPPMKVNNVEAFGISVETILTSLVTHPNYTGLTIVRSFSPDHYEGGAWNTGGSCTGKVKPLAAGELVENGFTGIMHKKQVTGYDRAIKKRTNKSKLKLMDITEAFSYRHDGHPGPYRSPDPNKITKRGPDGRPPPQDCLHWCMPGPVDIWNELVLEIIQREIGDSKSSFS